MKKTDETALTLVNEQSPQQFKERHEALLSFVKGQLKMSKTYQENGKDKMSEGDYGIIPRTNKKSLLKPGAEKLLKLFGLSAKLELMDKVEDWTNGFIFYRYKCTITHIATSSFIADATRTCTNKEPKHASKNIYEVANTIEAVSQKRALVAATVQATMASEIFDAEGGEFDQEAPKRTVTKDEDPRRIKVLSGYFAAAKDRGFTNTQAENAAKRKLNVTSLKDVPTNAIEELMVELVKKIPVKTEPVVVQEPIVLPEDATADDVVEAEIVSGAAPLVASGNNYCRACLKKLDDPEVREEKQLPAYFCDKICQEKYYPPKTKRKLEEMVEKGKAILQEDLMR